MNLTALCHSLTQPSRYSELFRYAVLASIVCTAFPGTAHAQHDHEGDSKVKAPRVFLDKSPRIVAYQLKRLSNEQLLAIETATDDPKYLPVFNAILTRDGMSRAYREDALAGMVTINKSNAVAELAEAVRGIKGSDQSAKRTVRTLATVLLSQPSDQLLTASDELIELATSDNQFIAAAGYGGLLAAEQTDQAWELANENSGINQLLNSITLVPNEKIRGKLHARVAKLVDASKTPIQVAALRALAAIPTNLAATYELAASKIGSPELRTAAVRTMLKIPTSARDELLAPDLIKALVDYAEQTPAANRTEAKFLDAMQLVDQLLASAPSDLAKKFRDRLSETVVRVVRVHTVEEEMRYDIPFFAVEAGRPVQVVLVNEDLMPHNLVICKPGTLKEVAEEGLAIGPKNGLDGKQYVPKSDDVLFATQMIGSLETEQLTFTAPSEPGEYPYVCTFPRHWMRMYGVMVVVEDLDAWSKDPVEPKDPVGSNRSFVQAWNVKDFDDSLEKGLQGRSPQIGERIFTEATCAQCHKIGQYGVGGVGPELSKTFAKFKGDSKTVLQEVLDPSHRIDEKYAVHLILDLDGQTFSGLIVSQNKEKIELLENPEAKEATVILQDDIDQIVKTSNSMMPKGLMDRFSKDEILELVAFMRNLQE
ncbi:MAG: plastocyanin/azurin family copper-binding protein [Pirellulaceae bacterium]